MIKGLIEGTSLRSEIVKWFAGKDYHHQRVDRKDLSR